MRATPFPASVGETRSVIEPASPPSYTTLTAVPNPRVCRTRRYGAGRDPPRRRPGTVKLYIFSHLLPRVYGRPDSVYPAIPRVWLFIAHILAHFKHNTPTAYRSQIDEWLASRPPWSFARTNWNSVSSICLRLTDLCTVYRPYSLYVPPPAYTWRNPLRTHISDIG